MPKPTKTPVKPTGQVPLRQARINPAIKRNDPRDPGRGRAKGRPTGGRPPRFPGRTGGR